MGSIVLEHAIKVRKPYTITKERERWTEEEHNKFLEALKLYGRAWRQIEEHIGSKTAVQIRSHAQKFFTKIPPPRPKKRPMHPYPRKPGNLPSIPVMEKFPVSEQDNESPSSVLSSTSDQMNVCTSPVSSVAGSDPVGTLPCEQENECHSAFTSVDDEDETLPQHMSDMELDLGRDNSSPSKVSSSVEAPLASLKLFGKMVVVADGQKPPCFDTEDAEPAITINAGKPSSLNADDAEPVITIDSARQFAARVHEQCITDGVVTSQMGEGSIQWNRWVSSAASMFYLLPSHANLLPWFWASFSDEHQSSVRKCSDDGSVQKESSAADSNSIESTIKGSGDKLRRSETSAFRSLKATPKKQTKGFVPYKRCLSEREGENQKAIDGSNGEGSQGARLGIDP